MEDVERELGPGHEALDPAWIEILIGARWFAGKARTIRSASMIDSLDGPEGRLLLLVRVEYVGAEAEVYAVPAASAGSAEAAPSVEFWEPLRLALAGEDVLHAHRGSVERLTVADGFHLAANADWQARLLQGEQSNTSAILGGRIIVKLFRRLWEGENPEWEIGRVLTEMECGVVAPLIGGLSYRDPNGTRRALALAHQFVPHRGTGWDYALESIRGDSDGQAFFQSIEGLGATTAELHLALAAAPGVGFVPEPWAAEDGSAWIRRILKEAEEGLSFLDAAIGGLREKDRALAGEVLGRRTAVLERITRLGARSPGAFRIRCHGDYHLGQVLVAESRFVIIDFEGETTRPLAQRREKASPLLDVAGMIRSFHYASRAMLRSHEEDTSVGDRRERLQTWFHRSAQWFLRGYLERAGGAPFLSPDETDVRAWLDVFQLRKAIYELGYELNHRPDWVSIPLEGILELTDQA